ncbi:MAG: hypothetical protein Q9213_006049 [Squamulea squamosa]
MFRTAVCAVVAATIGYFFTKMYQARMLLIEREKAGLPVAPGHNFLLGHLLFFKAMMDPLPKDAHYELAFGDIFRQYFAKDGAFYIDLWPLSGLYLAVISPTAATQAVQTSAISCERPRLLERFFKPIAGGPNLFDLVEKEWRPWRTVFNKGFSTDHIYSLVPGMVDNTRIYCETLRKLAERGDMFLLDPTTLRYTMDLIGTTILCVNISQPIL